MATALSHDSPPHVWRWQKLQSPAAPCVSQGGRSHEDAIRAYLLSRSDSAWNLNQPVARWGLSKSRKRPNHLNQVQGMPMCVLIALTAQRMKSQRIPRLAAGVAPLSSVAPSCHARRCTCTARLDLRACTSTQNQQSAYSIFRTMPSTSGKAALSTGGAEPSVPRAQRKPVRSMMLPDNIHFTWVSAFGKVAGIEICRNR